VETYSYARMNKLQYQCTISYESCGNSCKGSDYYSNCLSSCFSTEGVDYDYCSTYYPNGNHNNKDNKGNDFETWNYIDCVGISDNNGAYYYIGAYCSNGGSGVQLGLFTDNRCTISAPTGTYEALTGYPLPYTNTSIIGSDSVGCKSYNYYNNNKNNNNKNNNNNNNDDVALEACQKVYQASAKCESQLNITNPDTSSCAYVKKGVAQMSQAMATDYTTARSSSGSVIPTVFAVLFGIMTFLTCGYVYFLRQMLKRRLGSTNSSTTLASKVGGDEATGEMI